MSSAKHGYVLPIKSLSWLMRCHSPLVAQVRWEDASIRSVQTYVIGLWRVDALAKLSFMRFGRNEEEQYVFRVTPLGLAGEPREAQ